MRSTHYFCLVLASLTHWTYSTSYDYIVHTYTTDSLFAGTDASVYIKFYRAGKLLMDEKQLHPESSDPFNQGDHDKSLISLGTHLGEISNIQIKRGSVLTFGKWYLDKVVVEDPIKNVLYVFNCYCKLNEANRWKKITGSVDCKSGYFLSNKKCDDVKCKNAGICKDTNAICTNTNGSYHCRNCKDGYYYDGGKCQDIDECQKGTSKCEQKCQNFNGGYSCGCFKGFQLKKQYQCADVDECKNPQQCDSHATCVNEPGTFTCKCFSGYENQNDKCINIDECTRYSPCHWKTSVGCIDTDGWYRCDCKQGYYNEKDGSCKDTNECQGQNTCDPKRSVCENLEGTYRCNCLPGFIMSADGKRCNPRTCNPLIIPNGGVVFPSRCTKQDSNSYNDVCTISCKAGYRISDYSHSKLTCGQHASWVGTVPTCTPVSCKSLLSPTNGRIIPSLCSAGGKYTQKCSFLCNDGYVRNGADEAVCQEDGRWSAITPTCDKVTSDAWIRCPPGISAVLKPDENTANISGMWKLPQLSSNVKYISSSHNKKDRFPVGMTFVTWTVSSDNLRKKNCSFAVSVYDKEKPVAVDCPKQPLAILTTKNKELVHLTKVRFTDNVGIKSIEYSRSSPVELSHGTHAVTVIGKDTSNNIGYCIYEVIVKGKPCGALYGPLDGDIQCRQMVGSNFCAVTCRGNKVVFNATGYWQSRTWYCLANDPVWMPAPKVPDCVDYTIYNGYSCPAGKVLVKTTLPSSASSNVHVCGACPSGTFYENGQCKGCPTGTYLDTTGNNGVASCKQCDPNTSSKPGSIKKVDCKATCSPGYYSADGFNPCELCKRGEYQPNFASKYCNKCPQGRTCTRHKAAVAIESCGPCPVITRVVPSGNVQRLLGSTFKMSCYMNATGLARQLKWRINLDDSGQQVSGVYMKKLYDSNSEQIGGELKVRGLTDHHSGTYKCVVENQFGEDSKSVHVSVVSNSQGSGFGPLNDDE